MTDSGFQNIKHQGKVEAALTKVMAAVGTVAKEGTNEFHNYAYAQAADVLFALQKHLAKEGVVIVQSEIGREVYGEKELLAITYEFIISHTSGEEYRERPRKTGMASFMNKKGGFDDKAANKCSTAAHKYMLIELFKIPTGEFDDADNQEDRPPKKAKPTERAQTSENASAIDVADAPQSAPAIIPTAAPTISDKPHELPADDLGVFGQMLAGAVRAAKTETEIQEWESLNRKTIAAMAEKAPGYKKRLDDIIGENYKRVRGAAKETKGKK